MIRNNNNNNHNDDNNNNNNNNDKKITINSFVLQHFYNSYNHSSK